MVYLVTYDLRQPGRDYSSLHKHLRSYGGWCKPLESVWLIPTSLSAIDLTNQVVKHLDSNDRLLVIPARHAAWYGLSDEVVAWINTNVK